MLQVSSSMQSHATTVLNPAFTALPRSAFMEILKSLLNEAFEGADEDDASGEALKDDVEEDDTAENTAADAVGNADLKFFSFAFCEKVPRVFWEKVETDDEDADDDDESSIASNHAFSDANDGTGGVDDVGVEDVDVVVVDFADCSDLNFGSNALKSSRSIRPKA